MKASIFDAVEVHSRSIVAVSLIAFGKVLFRRTSHDDPTINCNLISNNDLTVQRVLKSVLQKKLTQIPYICPNLLCIVRQRERSVICE
ncbi:hypothetical protein [Candidatus Binatus sp.]|uniref:hypothetical protein n=1 Tax=Candidatus Binatus sp. TaxID=2811406 RepID=UPI002F937D3D